MKWLIGLIITAMVSWFIDALLGAVIRRWAQAQLKKVWGAIRSSFVTEKTFDYYFTVIGLGKIDYIIYQHGLRPKIPIVDLLYLEFLHSLLIADCVNKILLFPSIDLTYPSQKSEDFVEFKEKVLGIFRNYKDKKKIRFIDPFTSDISAEDFLSVDFLETIKFVGSSEFITFARNRLNLKISSFSDFNKYHPEDIRLLSTYTHLIRNGVILSYLRKNRIIDNMCVNLGFLIWETEVDKLGVFVKLSNKNPNITLTPILGKSILFEKGKPIPVFEPSITLNIFDDAPNLILKLGNKNDKEAKIYMDILSTILAKNYGENVDLKTAYTEGINLFTQYTITYTEELKNVNELTKKAYITLSLIHSLRRKYEGR